jgi:hypothetical protein
MTLRLYLFWLFLSKFGWNIASMEDGDSVLLSHGYLAKEGDNIFESFVSFNMDWFCLCILLGEGSDSFEVVCCS